MPARPQQSNVTVEDYQIRAQFIPWHNRRLRMFPLWFFELYLTLTVMWFAFGPWKWPVDNPFLFYVFLFGVQVSLWLGYISGLKYVPKGYADRSVIMILFTIALIANILWIGPRFMVKLGLDSPNPYVILNAIISGTLDPGGMYLEKIKILKNYVEGGASTLEHVVMALEIISWPLIPLSIVYWDYLKIWMRISAMICIVLTLSAWIVTGTNKGIADFVGLMPWLLLMRNPRMLAQMKMHQVAKIAFLCILLVGMFLVFFSMGQYGRHSNLALNLFEPTTGMMADENDLVLKFLPQSWQGPYTSLASYVTQGYYGLSLALQEPFVFCYGVGNSWFTIGLARRFLGWSNMLDMTYPGRILGWDVFTKWQSFYTWIASDVSFPGVMVVVFLIGRLFAMVWLDVLRKENPFAIVLFSLLVIMLYYLPANNQVLGNGITAVPFWIFLLFWFFKKGRASCISVKNIRY